MSDPRTPLTSGHIQQRHPAVYQRLMEGCQTVVSVPMAAGLAGDRFLHARQSNLLLQLPRRVWVGVQAGGEQPVTVRTLEEYDAARGEFVPAPATIHERTQHLVQDLLVAGEHLTVDVLLEAPDGRGFALSSSLTAAVSLALLVHRGTIAPVTVDAWRRLPMRALLDDPAFLDLVRLAKGHQSAVRPGRIVGGGVLTALGSASVQLSAHDGQDVDVLTLADLGGGERMACEWPVDLLIIASGSRNDLGLPPEVRFNPTALPAFLAELTAQLRFPAPLAAPLPTPVPELVHQLRDAFFLEVVRCWTAVWSGTPTVERAIEDLLATMRRRQAFSEATDALHPSTVRLFAALGEALGDRPWGAFPVNNGSHGGTVLVVAPAGALRPRAPQLLVALAARGMDGACIEYLSWRDGAAVDPVRVDQHLASGQLSALLPREAQRWTFVSPTGTASVLRPRDVELPSEAELVVDLVNDRIIIAGQPVDSKEIKSQRFTAELLRHLARAPQHTVPNSALPRSAYRASRSELVSKILAPLARTVLARTGRELSYTTHGSMDDFSISLQLGDLTLALVESVGE